MPSKLTAPSTEQANASTTGNPSSSPTDVATHAAQKRAATLLRHKQETRADRLEQMRHQIENGTLVVRYMPVAQRTAPSADS
jgi:anti-sigma28 factor (negative regulator of flagellin synthesis)